MADLFPPEIGRGEPNGEAAKNRHEFHELARMDKESGRGTKVEIRGEKSALQPAGADCAGFV
jgi:hypothetical protein